MCGKVLNKQGLRMYFSLENGWGKAGVLTSLRPQRGTSLPRVVFKLCEKIQ